MIYLLCICIVVQSLSHVRLFVTPWTAACKASLSITKPWSLLKLMYIESVMPSNHFRKNHLSITISWSLPKFMSIASVMPSSRLILCTAPVLLPSIFPRIRAFSMSQLFTSGGQSIGVSASTSVLPMNIQD